MQKLPPILLHDRTARIPVARYATLYRLINESLDDEGFALFSRPLRRGSFEFLCRAVLSAPTLGRRWSASRASSMSCSTTSMSRVEAQRTRRRHRHRRGADAAGKRRRARVCLRMAAAHDPRPCRLAGGPPAAAGRGQFPYPPPLHAADYELVFAPRYTFDAPRLEARFPAEWLALPVRRDEAALTAFLVDAPASITTLYRRDRALALRVREHLRAALPEHLALPALAKRMFLSPRTLHRRLEDEGTSFPRHQGRPAPRTGHRLADQDHAPPGPHRCRPRLCRRRRLLPRLHRLDRQRPARVPATPRTNRSAVEAPGLNGRTAFLKSRSRPASSTVAADDLCPPGDKINFSE
jgi:AraC-like DNA-binding protein